MSHRPDNLIGNANTFLGSGFKDSISNPMYKNIHSRGILVMNSQRDIDRRIAKECGITLSKKRKFWELNMT